VNAEVRRGAFAFYLFIVSSTFAGEVFQNTIEKTVSLDAGGTFSLHSIDGTVEIYGAEENEVKIVAIRKAFSIERLNKIQIQVTGNNEAVKINTIGPAQPRWSLMDRSGTVDYTITLPQHARISSVDVPNGDLIIHGMRGGPIRASLGNGRMTMHDCYCDQTVQVERGGLDLFFDWNDLRPITVEGTVVHGSIRAVIPDDSSFRLHAVSEFGRVASEFTEMAERRRGGVSQIDEVIGPTPLSKLLLRTTHGNIKISQMIW
jgi:hypothetical protein